MELLGNISFPIQMHWVQLKILLTESLHYHKVHPEGKILRIQIEVHFCFPKSSKALSSNNQPFPKDHMKCPRTQRTLQYNQEENIKFGPCQNPGLALPSARPRVVKTKPSCYWTLHLYSTVCFSLHWWSGISHSFCHRMFCYSPCFSFGKLLRESLDISHLILVLKQTAFSGAKLFPKVIFFPCVLGLNIIFFLLGLWSFEERNPIKAKIHISETYRLFLSVEAFKESELAARGTSKRPPWGVLKMFISGMNQQCRLD